MKTAGVVFDFYDDPTGAVLKKFFPTPEELPEAVKTAHILSEEEREVLRNEAYALVMVNEGRVLRKFACVDPGNTLLSALYFLEHRENLPEEAEKVAAANIFKACEEFGLPIDPLVKEAAKSSASRTRDPMKQPLVGDEADWAQRTNLVSIRGGGDTGRVGETVSNLKTAGANVSPVVDMLLDKAVDVTGKEPKKSIKKTASAISALGGKYSLDSYADVQMAVRYFEENYREMDPEDAHQYAVKTAARADQLGIEVPETLARYGSTEYSPDVDAALALRRSMVDLEKQTLFTELQEKRAFIEPEQFAELLTQADEAAGLNWFYGHIPDPYFSTFGGNAKKEKLASWSWDSPTGQRVNAEQLKKLAVDGNVVLSKHFADEMVEGFSKNPVEVFDSMPAPQKEILANLALSMSESL
jgi:hypothetical protein